MPEIETNAMPMTGDDLYQARRTLAAQWCLPRPLTPAQMARLLHLEGKRGAEYILKMEAGTDPIRGPTQAAVELMLDGATPRHLEAALGPRSIEPA